MTINLTMLGGASDSLLGVLIVFLVMALVIFVSYKQFCRQDHKIRRGGCPSPSSEPHAVHRLSNDKTGIIRNTWY